MSCETRVHIVDDDEAVRNALGLLMESVEINAKTYDSAEAFLDQYNHDDFGCLLLDLRMPGMNGLELLDELNKRKSPILVIFITGHGDVSMAVRAMKEGAIDFIEKPFDNDYLLQRVQGCLAESANNENDNALKNQILDKINQLTNREHEVMNLLISGKQNKLIARELNISTRTVEQHRANIMKKLNAQSLSDIVRAAMISEKFDLYSV